MEVPLSEVPCTEDVLFDGYGSLTFDNLDLPNTIIAGLNACGFRTLSPVQAEAIPIGIQNRDLLVQAKPGTGKTCVFSVVSLASVQAQEPFCQMVVMTATRHKARENSIKFAQMEHKISGLKTNAFGDPPDATSIEGVQLCHIAIGTPGRLAYMVKVGHLKLDKVKVLVLDEADQLMDCSAFSEDLQTVLSAIHPEKQIVALTEASHDLHSAKLGICREPLKLIQKDWNKKVPEVEERNDDSPVSDKVNELLGITIRDAPGQNPQIPRRRWFSRIFDCYAALLGRR